MKEKGCMSKINKPFRLLKRICAFVLCAAVCLGCFYTAKPMKAEASSTRNSGVRDNRGMILKITMGSVTTDQILYFCVKYYDSKNVLRNYYITPTDKSLQEGLSLVESKIGSSTADMKLSYLDAGEYKNNKYYYKGLGSVFNSYTKAKALVPYDTNYFYFETPYEFGKIAGVSFFARYREGGKNEISIQDVSLYKVSYLYDIDMERTVSGSYFIDFEGKRLMKSKIERTFSWSQADTVFDFDSLKYYDKTTVDFGKKFYSAEYNTDKLSNISDDREINHSVKYSIQINIADIAGAGAEFNNSRIHDTGSHSNFYDLWVRECLDFELEYTDSEGLKHIMQAPVILSSLYKAFSGSGDVSPTSVVSGFFQQGESVIFDVLFLNTSEVNFANTKLKYGRELAKKELGYEFKTEQQSLSKNCNLKDTGNDKIVISSVVVYDSFSSTYKASMSGGFVDAVITGNPVWYYKGITGFEIPEESTVFLQLQQYSGGEITDNTINPVGKFLITLKTDSPASASTTADINVKIHYLNYSGKLTVTDAIKVKDAVSDYCGYWPCMNNKNTVRDYQYFAYESGAYSDGTLSFIVDVSNVDRFVGMTFSVTSLDPNPADDWQCTAIGIYELTSVGKRVCSWNKTSTDNYYSDRTISRSYKGINISPTMDGAALVEPGTEVYVEFTSGGSLIEDNDVDLRELRYHMSYEDALQNLGFTKQRAIYNVKVAVAGNIADGTPNEDCGSRNRFYFKLVFEDGASAYVLANQQLSSDGFTSGVEHEFQITTNRDMGQLVAVKILPENQNEDSDVFDKLKINTITVSKAGREGLSLSWKIDINDWITIDYSDKGAKDSIRGQSGRTENDLAQTFRVTSSGYSLNMMFAIETIGYLDNQFEGRISVDIDYIDSNNSIQTRKITDLVSRFNEYAGKTADKKTFTPVNANEPFEATEINRKFFLFPNHTDRFFVSLDDVTQIVRMNVTLKGTTAGRWRIGGVSAYRVITVGNRILNENNEYQYSGEVKLVAQSNNGAVYDFQYIASGIPNTYQIAFGENKIDVDLSNTWISSVSYIPQSNDDSINVYAYMKDNMKNLGTYELKMEADYSLSDETDYQTFANLKAEPKSNMFYAKGIQVSGMRSLRRIGLKSDSIDIQVAKVDYMIVEHIRSGVVINTYYIDFGGADVGMKNIYVYSKPSTDTRNSLEKQTLTFMVSNDSLSPNIVKDASDLAVCLTYTSSCDPESGTLTSPNMFVSDLNISKLTSGSIITMEYSQKYVKDITGITFIAQGGVSDCVKIKSARVSSETKSDENYEIENIYSFGSEMTDFITFSPKKMTLTASTSESATVPQGSSKSVGILSVGLTSKGGVTGLPGGAKVRMKIAYYDDYGQIREMTVQDISKVMTGGSLNPGDKLYLRIMISGISAVRYMEFEPYDAAGTGSVSWALASVDYSLSVKPDIITDVRYPNATVVTGSPETVGFGNVSLKVAAYISAEGSEEVERRGFSYGVESSEGILTHLGGSVSFTPSIEGSISGINVKCHRVSVTAAGSTVTNDVTGDVLEITTNEGLVESVLFNPETAGDYRIVFSSQEISSVTVEINVSVTE